MPTHGKCGQPKISPRNEFSDFPYGGRQPASRGPVRCRISRVPNVPAHGECGHATLRRGAPRHADATRGLKSGSKVSLKTIRNSIQGLSFNCGLGCSKGAGKGWASSVISISLSVLPREPAASSVIGISLSVLPRELALRSWLRMDRRCAANWSGSQVPPGHDKRYEPALVLLHSLFDLALLWELVLVVPILGLLHCLLRPDFLPEKERFLGAAPRYSHFPGQSSGHFTISMVAVIENRLEPLYFTREMLEYMKVILQFPW